MHGLPQIDTTKMKEAVRRLEVAGACNFPWSVRLALMSEAITEIAKVQSEASSVALKLTQACYDELTRISKTVALLTST